MAAFPGEENVNDLSRREALGLIGPALLATTLPLHAQSGQPLKIGFGMALSGGLAAGGKASLIAYQIWADDVNAKGGLLGRKVELVHYDDQSSAATVPGIYSKLLDIDKVDIVVSGYATVPTAAAMPIIIQRGKTFMSLFALAANDKFRYDRYFSMLPAGPEAKYEFSRGFFELAATLDPKPQTVAFTGADAEFSIQCLEGARENAKKIGLKSVYDRSYPPNTIDYTPIVRSIKAANPDIVFYASYPPDSSGLIKATHEVGLGAKMLGGGMVGLQFAALKTLLGPMLNNIAYYDVYVPEPTMKFPGIEQFITRYRERAAKEGVEPLGFYLPPFAYAEMQILEAAVTAAGSLDDAKIAEQLRTKTFPTVVGDLKFGDRGEWAEPRILLAQFQGISGYELEQFKQPGKQVVLYPPRYKSGDLKVPFEPIKR
jgi:branched-chain amino acid transport system substrate-binding protein